MSTSRNILHLLGGHEKTFSQSFTFYLDAIDEVMTLQGQIGLDADKMIALPEHDQALIKTYVFLVESGNTTWAAALRLLSSGFAADSYGLIRILYETSALLHYGNSSPPETRTELYNAMFKSRIHEREHRKNEWNFTQMCICSFEKDKPELATVRRELNNFGGHISRAKILMGNLTITENVSASSVFTPNWRDNRYLAGLDFLYSLNALIIEEYAIMQRSYGGLPAGTQEQLTRLTKAFISSVRPKLQAMMKTS